MNVQENLGYYIFNGDNHLKNDSLREYITIRDVEMFTGLEQQN